MPDPQIPTDVPELLVDEHGLPVGQDVSAEPVLSGADFFLSDPLEIAGIPAPLGRRRVVTALPLKDGPVLVKPPQLVRDPEGYLLQDPVTLELVGPSAPVWVHRMIVADRTWDTRGL